MPHRPWTRSQTEQAKIAGNPGSSATPLRSQILKEGRSNPFITPIKIEEPKESSSSPSSPSSSSALYTESLSPPPSPTMDDQLPPPPPAQKSLADYNKPSATSVRSAIAVPRIEGDPDYEIKIPFLTMISRDLQFEGRPLDNPCIHLADFLDLCSTFKNGNLDKNTLCLRAFPFSLKGAAKRWLTGKPPGYYTNWDTLAQDFVEEYFPPARTTAINDSIARFSQKEGESLYDTWNRFQELLYTCPHHGFEQRQLAEIFSRGL